jgi:hypothetical protein
MDEHIGGEGESHVLGERGIRGFDTLMDSLAAMVRQESEHYPPVGDYLEVLRSFPSSEPDPVSENWRRQLCEWCYDGTFNDGMFSVLGSRSYRAFFPQFRITFTLIERSYRSR